jgi:hypothetical protein
MKNFVRFMVSNTGRALRIIVGLALIAIGAFFSSGVNWVLIIIGILPLATGLFDICVFSPLLGYSFSGKKTRMALLMSSWLFVLNGFAQSALRPVAQMVQEHRISPAVFQKSNLFDRKQAFVPAAGQTDVLPKGTLLTIDDAARQAILRDAPAAMEFTLPTVEWGDLTLDLVKVDLFSPDFRVETDKSGGAAVEVVPGVFYRGIIKGHNNSLASIAISNHEIMGFVSDERFGNLVLGKLDGLNPGGQHLLYASRELKLPAAPFCDMPDEPGDPAPDGHQVSERSEGDCVRLWIEVDRDLTNAAEDDVSFITAWITGLFSQVITLFANEQLEVGIHHIFVWTGEGDNQFKGANNNQVLSHFQSFRSNSFTGDLAIVCNLKNFGGRAAGYSGLCNNNRKKSMCYAGLHSSYENVPTYSFNVEVCTHELGHLLGSRHTHACVWNGNNTALDDCYETEGGCPPGPPAITGGTIMSYCHITSYGINFSNGFGPQPGDKIRSTVANAGCLAASCGNSADRTGLAANQSSTMTLLPNPATDRVRIELNVRMKEGERGVIRVFNVQGELVATLVFRHTDTTLTLATSDLAPGLYFVDLATSAENLGARLILH